MNHKCFSYLLMGAMWSVGCLASPGFEQRVLFYAVAGIMFFLADMSYRDEVPA